MFSVTVFIFIYYLLSVTYLSFGVSHSNRTIKASLKCAPIFILILWFVTQWNSEIWVCVPNSNRLNPIPESSLSSEWTFYLMVFSLIASLLGDAFLVSPVTFPIGVASFGIAQVLYSFIIISFSLTRASYYNILVSGLCVMALDALVLVLVSQRLKIVLDNVNRNRRLIGVLIILYFILISLMLWTALIMFFVFFNISSFIGFLGALLFYVSDLSIAMSAVFPFRIFRRRILVMITYYTAQLLITICVLSVCTK